jgi:MFS family permease
MSSKYLLGESWLAWLALAVGVLAVSAHSASSVVFSVLMKPILGELGWSRTDFATGMNLRMLVMIAVIPFAGLFTDRLGPRLVLAAGALIVGTGIISMAKVHSLWALFGAMLYMGPGQAGIGSVAASALVLRLFQRRPGLAIGMLNGGDNLINSAVPLIAATLLLEVGWRATLVSFGTAYLALGILILWLLRERARAEPAGQILDESSVRGVRPTLRELPWRNRSLWLVFVSYACIYAYITSVQLHLHAFQTDIGRTAAEASRILSVQILVGAVGAPLFGWIAERRSAPDALRVAVAVLAATSIVMWTARDYHIFIAWAVLHGMANSGTVALLALVLNELFGVHQIGRLMGVAMVFCMTATMLGNLFSASMFDHFGSYRSVWQIYTALLVFTMISLAMLRRRLVN